MKSREVVDPLFVGHLRVFVCIHMSTKNLTLKIEYSHIILLLIIDANN